MSDALRPDGKPFVRDTRENCPRYVVEDDDEGRVVVLNQFTGASEIVSKTRPYSEEDLVFAYCALRRREHKGFPA